MRHPKVDWIDWNEAQRLRNEGISVRQIAKMYGVSDYTISYNTKDFVDRPKWEGDTPQVLRDAGWSLEQIATELHSTPEEIAQVTHEPAPRKQYVNEFNIYEPPIMKSADLI